MKRNAIAIFLAAFLLIVFAVQCRIPCLTAVLAVRTGEHEIYRVVSCLIVHGSAKHVIVNSAALIILLYGFGRRTSVFLIVHALPAALCAVWLYVNSLMPDRAWLCGASPLLFALFGLIAWRERKTSVFSLFGIRWLSLPPIPMLGIVLLTDALFSKAVFSFIAWPVHTFAGLGGLLTGMLLFFKPLRNPRYATAAIFIAAALAVLLITGCVSGNRAEVSAVKIESRKSTTAENIEASGRVLGGAWDRLLRKDAK
jgi:membrane associated rhomboid family serine protease